MSSRIKAVVFKTPQLDLTKKFFEQVVQLSIKEASAQHFVVYAKGIRLVFVESDAPFSTELYVAHKSTQGFEKFDDPNGIRVITVK